MGSATDPDAVLAALAARQRGLVTRRQLLATGVPSTSIDWGLKKQRLHPVHRGVYLVGHAIPPPLALELAAVLACGEGAVLSHRSAASLWRLAAAPEAPQVTVPRGRRPRRSGLEVHQSKQLDAADVGRLDRIPVTAVARTLIDLAEVASPRDLERAYDEARTRLLVRLKELQAALERHPGRRGVAAIRSLIERDHGPTLTRSEAEELFLALIRRARLPQPDVNVRVGPYLVDFLWREERLVIEIDGHAFHSLQPRRERDHARDSDLRTTYGMTLERFTARQVKHEPEVVLARVARALVA